MEVFFDNLFEFMGNYLIIVAWIIMWVTTTMCLMNGVKNAWSRLWLTVTAGIIAPIVFPIVIGGKLAEWVLGEMVDYEDDEDDKNLKL